MFHVGDVVEFKTWDEMEEEFGLNNNGSINCACVFTSAMEDLVDRRKTYTITRTEDIDCGIKVYFSEEPCVGCDYVVYSTDMIKLVENGSEDLQKNIIDISKWKINVDIPNFTSEISVRREAETKYLVDIIKTLLLDKASLFVSVDSLIGPIGGIIKYYKQNYSDENPIVAFVESGRENYENYFETGADEFEVKIANDGNVTLLVVPRFKNYYFNDGRLIQRIVSLLSDVFPTEDKELLTIRECVYNNDESGVEIRDNYIRKNAEIKRKRIMDKECDRLGDIILRQKAKDLDDEVERITAQLEEAKRQYYNYMMNLEEAKKNLAYFKYVNTDKKESDLENIIRADIESGELINFRASGDTLYFKIVEPLLYFDEDKWQMVKDGVISESGQKAYEPILDAIFTRKCTLTIEQGASICMSRVSKPLHCYQWREGRSLGIPNSHMERYDCWDDNEGNALEYIISGDYDSAYIQMKSAIAGINVCDSPVIYEFCRYMDDYSCIRCITDNETGQLFTIEEANEYYKELAKGEAA